MTVQLAIALTPETALVVAVFFAGLTIRQLESILRIFQINGE